MVKAEDTTWAANLVNCLPPTGIPAKQENSLKHPFLSGIKIEKKKIDIFTSASTSLDLYRKVYFGTNKSVANKNCINREPIILTLTWNMRDKESFQSTWDTITKIVDLLKIDAGLQPYEGMWVNKYVVCTENITELPLL